MRQILVYADSLTWGIIPNTRLRFPFDERWPGVLENRLNDAGHRVRLIEINSPLSLVILMLGTNDFQFSHPHNNAWSAAQGVATLVNEIRRAPIEPGMPVPPVLVVCPPPIRAPRGPAAEKFAGADERSAGLADAYRAACAALACHFFDSSTVASSSHVDGVHLDRDQHLVLGQALAGFIAPMLGPDLQNREA